MRAIIIFFVTAAALQACGLFGGDDNEDFMKAYEEILIVREKYPDDKIKARSEIGDVYEKYGYTEESFKEKYFEMSEENPQKLYRMIDSLRKRAEKKIYDKKEKKSDVKQFKPKKKEE